MNIYFCGIGGVGLGPLAEVAQDMGHTVLGSDPHAGLMTNALKKRGISIYTAQDGTDLEQAHTQQPIDWFVFSAAIPESHPERIKAADLGIKSTKRDGLLSHIISEKNLKLIAISGTHGKTTTTSMFVWALKQLNIPVSYIIGTTLTWGQSGVYDAESEYFVYECDEFDRNFLHFYPTHSIVTSLDYDHPDTYSTEVAYYEAFSQFLQQSHTSVLWKHDVKHGLRPATSTHLLSDDELLSLSLVGKMNRANATLIHHVLTNNLDVDGRAVSTALESFPGNQRRFEKLADNIYTDYAHYPAEIAATIQAARELNDDVLIVYEPHQNVRQHAIFDQYKDCFTGASHVYWTPTYLSREDSALDILTPEYLISHLKDPSIATPATLDDTLWRTIYKASKSGTLVFILGAGTIDDWIRHKVTG